jgi:hypothetical protein
VFVSFDAFTNNHARSVEVRSLAEELRSAGREDREAAGHRLGDHQARLGVLEVRGWKGGVMGMLDWRWCCSMLVAFC